VRLWDVGARALVARLSGHPPGQVTLAFEPRGATFVSASGRDVRRWDAASGAVRGSALSASAGVHHLAWSPDGTRLAAGLTNGDLELWEPASGTVLLRVPHTAGVFFTAWARDGQRLFALPMDQTIRVLRASPR
jgi:WD40 repeat protein